MSKSDFNLKELAQLTNFSINTVSRALNNKEGVSRETRELIEKIARENNYRPNFLARSMRVKQTNLIGVLVGDIYNKFFINLLNGAEGEANKESMSIIIGNSNENIDKERKNIDAFMSYRCSGIAISPVSTNSEIIKRLKEENANFVVFDRPVTENIKCDQVSINNEDDSFEAIKYLIDCGHERIGIINSEMLLQTEYDRLLGYKRALESNNIEIDNNMIVISKNKEDAFKSCLNLLLSKSRPTALFVAKESLGLSIISAVMHLGLKVPNDISVIIYGDPEWASIFHPCITCVKRPVSEMGKIGVRILINKLRDIDTKEFKNIKLDSQLIIRESVKIF